MTREELSTLISQDSHTDEEVQQVLSGLLDLPPAEARELTTEVFSAVSPLQSALGESPELYDHILLAVDE